MLFIDIWFLDFVCIDVSKRTPYYKENATEIFNEFKDDYKYYVID